MYSGLNPTQVLRYIHMRLGSSLQVVELSDEEIMRIVFQESLRTYSKYFPYLYKEPITQADSIGGGYTNVYKIPNRENLEIIGVHRIWLENMNQFGGSLLPLTNDPVQSQLMGDMISKTVTPFTFEYQAPDLVTIRPKIYYGRGALLELKAQHPRHLRTIPMAMRDQFLRLALDDVLIALYPLRHRWENLSTPYGQLSLFLEMVDGAASDREALIDSWKENFLKDARAKKIWIA